MKGGLDNWGIFDGGDCVNGGALRWRDSVIGGTLMRWGGSHLSETSDVMGALGCKEGPRYVGYSPLLNQHLSPPPTHL